MAEKSTTWDDIRVIALQKMFLIEGSEVEYNDSTKPYLASMPAAYNEAVRLLSTTNRYIVKCADVECDGVSDQLKINLDEVIPDLYELKPNGTYFEYPDGRMAECGDFRFYGNSTLVLPGSSAGVYHIYYYAYPIAVTANTAGTTNLQIDPDVASLIPLYMASQLYKDDDIAIATTYRNEFEVGRDLLVRELNGSMSYRFSSVTGWW